MHNPYPTDHPFVDIRQTAKGAGVFATKAIPAGTLIAEFVGDIYTSETATGVPQSMVDHVVQVGENKFVHARNRLAEFVNHSCDPCAGIKNLIQIVTIRPIIAGEEITWDYAMTEMSDWRLENCLCGVERCRGTVGSFLLLPESVKQEYLAAGIVSAWIRKFLSI